jgi:hypothetical protein
LKDQWEVKSPLRRITTVGFYATKEEAMSEVFDHRMGYEGFERRGGYWYVTIPKSNTGGVGGVNDENETLPPAAKKARVEGPVPPHGQRPVASGAGKRGAVDVNESPADDYVDEEALRAAAKDQEYLKRSTKTARRPGKKKGWRKAPVSTAYAFQRREIAKDAAKANTEAATAWRAKAQNELSAAMSDRTWGTLNSLLVAPDAKEGDGDIFVSEAQHHRLFLQTMSVYNFYLVVGESHPVQDLRWCADQAAMRCGYQVAGSTVYSWSLEFGQHRGFLVDQRGTFERDLFIEQEDVKLAATAFMRSSLRGLSTASFAEFVNKTLIPQFVPGEVAEVAEKCSSSTTYRCPCARRLAARGWCGAAPSTSGARSRFTRTRTRALTTAMNGSSTSLATWDRWQRRLCGS